MKQQNYLLQPHFRQIKEITLADGLMDDFCTEWSVIGDDMVGCLNVWNVEEKKGNSENPEDSDSEKKITSS